MIHALVTGALWEAPAQHTSKNGNPFVAATVKIKDGDGAQWVKVLAFPTDAQDALLRLGAGDAISVQGSLKADVYQPPNRDARINLTVFVELVLPLRAPPKERKKEQPPDNRTKQQRCAGTWAPGGGPTDVIPF
jgi:Single-strand binding protein family